MTSVRWDDGMYTLKGNQQQKPLKINGWLVGWFRWHFLCKFTNYFSDAWNVSCLGCSFFPNVSFGWKPSFRWFILTSPDTAFQRARSCKVWGDEFSIQIGGSSCEHPMGIFHIHAYLPLLPQKTHLGAGSPSWNFSVSRIFRLRWCHHLTRSDKNPAYKAIIKKHVQMECP